MKTKLIIIPAKYYTCLDCGGVFKLKVADNQDPTTIQKPKYCSYCSKSKKKH